MAENKKPVISQELYRSAEEDKVRRSFVDTFKSCPIPDIDILNNLGLFVSSKNLSRFLFMHHLYEQIVDVPGIIIEFGTRWGQNMALFAALRGIYEPFNRHRKIVGFDTFSGFPTRAIQTGYDNTQSPIIQPGELATTQGYVEFLSSVMEYHEADNPLSHIKKFDIRQGDASEEILKYLEEFPETIVSLAYFDFDIYEPTKKCLEAIRSRLVKGSVLGFDELNDRDSPGETIALAEVFGLNNVRLRRWRYVSRTAYFVME
jgi:hypothetical protein